MIVEQLRVRNWRHLRDEHAFEFGEEMNLLIGPNEAGKSTLFEVLQRVLLDRHTGRAQEIRELRPIGSSLAPEAEVTLRSGDDRYRVRKRFLDSPISVLSVERDGNWEREHEGTRADEEARSLVEGDVPGKGATAREHRGLGEALWYLQREAPLPDDEWNEAIQEGLGGLIDVAASSSAERRILDRIADEYSETWTKSEGNLSKRSDLYDLKEEVEDLEEALEDVEAALKKADELRADLKSLLAEQERLAQELSDAQGRRESLREKLDEAEEVRERVQPGDMGNRSSGRWVTGYSSESRRSISRIC